MMQTSSWKFPLALRCALLAIAIAARASAADSSQPALRTISVNCANAIGPTSQVYRFSVGSDRAIIHLRPQEQKDLKFVHDQIGFQYIRCHGLLNEEMKTYSESPTGQPIYNWSNVDGVYDFLLSIGMKPFVELGFIPEKLASGNDHIFYWNGNTTPPRNYVQWGQFIAALTQHLTNRYGTDEVKRWYFEVWNEPNLTGFWHGSQADYFKLYATTAAAVKSVNAAYQVGGPATAGCQWIPEFIQFCTASHEPVDFVSTHTYGVKQGFLDANGNGQTVMDYQPTALAGSLAGPVNDIHASPLPNLPLYMTEWSTSYSPRDPVHDSYVSAAYILQTLRNIPAGVDGMSYWTFSDQFEEAGPPPSPFHGGFGLLNTQGLPKPAFFAYRFLHQLGDTQLQCDDRQAWATRANDSAGGANVSVLFWDFTMLHQDTPNPTYFARDLPAAPAGAARLSLYHLAAGDYQLKVSRVGYRHNDVYTAYVDLHSPHGLPHAPAILSDPIADQLRAHCTGAPETQRHVHIAAGASPWTLDLPVNQNDVYLVQMIRS
jgi:xylan 1,4-beta-xylosidase